MKKGLLLLPLVLLLGACSQDKKEDPPVPKTGVELVAVGPTNFGGVIVGQFRDAAIKVYNHGPDAVDTSALNTALTAPFKVQSIGAPCNSGTLNAGANCVVSIRFTPTFNGNFFQDFFVGDSFLRITGKGMVGGSIEISDSLWDTGQTVAGEIVRKNIQVTNQGDFPIQRPDVELIPGMTLGFNNCGVYIQPLSTCRIELVLQKTIAGVLSELVVFRVANSYSPEIQIVTDVVAGESAGSILFDNPPASVVADGETELAVATTAITDQYGNTVLDGTGVHFSSSNCTILSDRDTTTINGIVYVLLRTSTTKSNCNVSAISAEANGVLRIPQLAGPPHGTINVEPYTENVVANGQTQVVLKTLTIFDKFNNIVENGTEISFSLVGGGFLNTSVGTTVLGKTQVIVSSPSTPGTSNVVIRAGPVRDAQGTIIAYGAQGVYPINFTAGPPNGTIPVTSQYTGIYAVEDSAYEDLGFNIRSIITVGPVKDAQGNVVPTGTGINIVVENGVNVTFNQNNVTAYTDSAGRISFLVAGSGQRGYINITASTVTGASGSVQLWAYKSEIMTPQPTANKVELFEIVRPSGDIPLRTDRWATIAANYFGVTNSQDGSYYTVEKKATLNPQIYGQVPHFLYECLFTHKEYVVSGPCLKSNATAQNQQVNWKPNHSTYQSPIKFDTRNLNPLFSPKYIINLSNPAVNALHNTQYGFVRVTSYSLPSCNNNQADVKTLFRDPAIGFMSSLDKMIFFGGYYFNQEGHPTCMPQYYPSGNNIQVNSIYSGVGESTDESVNVFLSRQTGLEDPDNIGDYPPAHGGMRLVSKGNKLFGFGGANLLPGNSGVSSYNNLYSFNGTENKWSVIRPDNDPVEENTGGEPEARYQNGLVYVPENNSLYIVGGLKEYFCGNFPNSNSCLARPACKWESNSCLPAGTGDGRGWEGADDIWQLNLDRVDNPSDESKKLEWKKICGSEVATLPAELGGGANPAFRSCNLPTSGVYTNLESSPYNAEPVNVQAVWHKVRQKVYLFWREKTHVRAFDPYSGSITTPTDGTQTLAGAFQVMYNEISERLIGYFRNFSDQVNDGSTLKVFDLAPGEKYFFKVVVDIGPGARTNARNLILKIAGKATTVNPPAAGNHGLELRVFNFTSNQWELVADHAWGYQGGLGAGEILSYNIPAVNIPNYVSTEGKVEMMFNAKGSLNENGEMRVLINSVGIEGVF